MSSPGQKTAVGISPRLPAVPVWIIKVGGAERGQEELTTEVEPVS